jgi:hypothetical protein
MNNILDQDTLRERPPRYLSILTRINVLFGGFSVQFGALFFWFGMIFVLIFVGQSEAVHLFSADGEWVETEGFLLEINETSGEINEEYVYEYVFTYSVDGQSLRGESNATFGGEKEGDLVNIEYKSGDNNRSRIIGMTSEMFPAWVGLIIVIFPLIGLGFLFFGFKENIKALRLLRMGTFTRGSMASYEATNTRINDEMVYAYKFEFSANNKTFIAECKTHLTERVEDEETEKILYDKAKPTFNLVYDAMGAAPEIDRSGRIVQANVLALKVLISTVIGLLVNGLIFFVMYL